MIGLVLKLTLVYTLLFALETVTQTQSSLLYLVFVGCSVATSLSLFQGCCDYVRDTENTLWWSENVCCCASKYKINSWWSLDNSEDLFNHTYLWFWKAFPEGLCYLFVDCCNTWVFKNVCGTMRKLPHSATLFPYPKWWYLEMTYIFCIWPKIISYIRLY